MMSPDNPYDENELDLGALIHVLMKLDPSTVQGSLHDGYSAHQLEAIASKAHSLRFDILCHLSSLGLLVQTSMCNSNHIQNMGGLTTMLADLAHQCDVLEANAKYKLDQRAARTNGTLAQVA